MLKSKLQKETLMFRPIHKLLVKQNKLFKTHKKMMWNGTSTIQRMLKSLNSL
jgi:hypothetical protein